MPVTPLRTVVTHACTPMDPDGHESATRRALARKLADLMGCPFEGDYDPARPYDAPPYFVPSDTLVGAAAAALGVRGKDDLFGAVVSHAFVATKSITHALADAQAAVPDGWVPGFAAAVADVVLRGASAFSYHDALRAAHALLARDGEVRVKRATGIGGGGQHVVRDEATLRDVLDALPADELATFGIVVEENLRDVRTFSVGRVEAAGVVATYCGTQCLTPNNHGAEVYGGSELTVVRGEFERLLALELPAAVRMAVDQARRYDRAADAHFDGFFASRRNYDVVQGIDHRGRPRSGVLEQSWRLGGASGAELGAVETMLADPAVVAVRARCVERYGEGVVPPPGATLHYADVDARVGRLTKYTVVERHADAR